LRQEQNEVQLTLRSGNKEANFTSHLEEPGIEANSLIESLKAPLKSVGLQGPHYQRKNSPSY